MTTNKSLKRNVRARMSKTGERYTAARRQVLTKATAGPPAEPAEPGLAEPGVAEPEPLHGPTNRPLAEWFTLLDAAGGRDMAHPDIVKWLTAEHNVPSWWRQDITVRYEKHIGRRVLGQRGKTFSATATKTIAVPAAAVREAWLNEAMRARWLPDVELKLRPNKVEVAKRFDIPDGGGRVIVSFDPRGDSKTSLAIEHEKLPDAAAAKRWATFWRDRLNVLKQQLEASARGRVE